jgi:hypothetical protein
MAKIKTLGWYLLVTTCIIVAANLVQGGFWSNVTAILFDILASVIFVTHFELKTSSQTR